MKNLKIEAPIVISGQNISPLPLGSGARDVSIYDKSHRWLLLNSLVVTVNSRLERGANIAGNSLSPLQTAELIAALYEMNVTTKLLSLTDDFVPMMLFSQMQSMYAESEAFGDYTTDTSPLMVPANLTSIEWRFPRPLLLRPEEALKVSIRQREIPQLGGTAGNAAAYQAIGVQAGEAIAPVGAIFQVAAKGTQVNVNARVTNARDVPFVSAKFFDARNVPGATPSTGQGFGNSDTQELNISNPLNRPLRMDSLLGRWMTWPPNKMATESAFNPYEQPIVSIKDYAGYTVVQGAPFRTVFNPQVGGVLRFGGMMQANDVMKVKLTKQIENFNTTQFFGYQGLVALHGSREESL